MNIFMSVLMGLLRGVAGILFAASLHLYIREGRQKKTGWTYLMWAVLMARVVLL